MSASDLPQPEAESAARAGPDQRVFPDPRSMALLRLAVGLSLLIDLIPRLPEVEGHYGDLGAFPRADAYRVAPAAALILHNASGWWGAALLLLLLHGSAALALIAGYRPRAAAALCWLLSTSLFFRNPGVALPGDEWLRLLLFWGMFLPWADCWTVRPAPPRLGTAFLWSFFAHLALGISLIYVTTGSAPPPPLAFLGLLALLPPAVWSIPPGRWVAARLDRKFGQPCSRSGATNTGLSVVALSFLMMALLWMGVGPLVGVRVPWAVTETVTVLGLDLKPASEQSEWTLAAEGVRPDGTQVSLAPTGIGQSSRWARYLSYVAAQKNAGLAMLYGRYLAYQWNSGLPEQRVARVIVSRQDRNGNRVTKLAVYQVPEAATTQPNAAPQVPMPDGENSLSRK